MAYIKAPRKEEREKLKRESEVRSSSFILNLKVDKF